jgi:hypothetical protein
MIVFSVNFLRQLAKINAFFSGIGMQGNPKIYLALSKILFRQKNP